MNSTFWKFNIGHVATLLGVLVTVGGFWWRVAQQQQVFGDQLAGMVQRVTSTETELREIGKMGTLTTVVSHERRLADLERTVSMLTGIQTDISWIKRELNNRRHTQDTEP